MGWQGLSAQACCSPVRVYLARRAVLATLSPLSWLPSPLPPSPHTPTKTSANRTPACLALVGRRWLISCGSGGNSWHCRRGGVEGEGGSSGCRRRGCRRKLRREPSSSTRCAVERGGVPWGQYWQGCERGQARKGPRARGCNRCCCVEQSSGGVTPPRKPPRQRGDCPHSKPKR